jgi:hypothetical protein
VCLQQQHRRRAAVALGSDVPELELLGACLAAAGDDSRCRDAAVMLRGAKKRTSRFLVGPV